jgi:hypothetical protein
MSAIYDEIVQSIDPNKHKMEWSLSLGLEPHPTTGNNIWWTTNLNFMHWGDVFKGVHFYRQEEEDGPITPVSEEDVPRVVVERTIDFFENE